MAHLPLQPFQLQDAEPPGSGLQAGDDVGILCRAGNVNSERNMHMREYKEPARALLRDSKRAARALAAYKNLLPRLNEDGDDDEEVRPLSLLPTHPAGAPGPTDLPSLL